MPSRPARADLGAFSLVFLETLSHRQGRFLCRRAAVILKRFNKQYLQFSEVTKTSVQGLINLLGYCFEVIVFIVYLRGKRVF